MLVEYILYMHFLRVFSCFFLTPSPGILARSPGILAPSPGVEFLRLYFWISLGLVAPIAMRNFTQAAAKLSWRHPASSHFEKNTFWIEWCLHQQLHLPRLETAWPKRQVCPLIAKKQVRKKTIPTRTPELCQIEMAGCKKQWKASS